MSEDSSGKCYQNNKKLLKDIKVFLRKKEIKGTICLRTIQKST